VEAEAEDRGAERLLGTQEQRDEQAVAVEERVDGLELDVGEAGLDEGRRTKAHQAHVTGAGG
jgi:hypothetical protein